MDITHIRYFLKTAELLNYTHAAEQLFITRQSLRQAIAAMEAELGQPLFTNMRNKLALTEYGAYLAASGMQVIAAFDRMQEGLARLSRSQTMLHVGFSVSLFPFILPETESILRAFRAAFPHITLDVEHLENDQIIDAVSRGELDCGCVIQMPCRREGSVMRRFAGFDAAIDFSDSSPLSGKKEIMLSDLDGIPCIGMGSLEKTLHPVYTACQEQGLTLHYTPTISTIDAFYQIQHGLAVGFDIYKPDAPGYYPQHTAHLAGYSWEMGMLCAEPSRDAGALHLFCAFLEQAYQQRMKGTHP
ncbi:MAG: LysR family transcriptional regulator [Clostridia bacterium]|nr:LysR family transcriptional regulator [Clostridia bacterium]